MIYRDYDTVDTQSGATYSDCESYRYTLWRKWGVGPWINFLMLNPSTATERANDPTVERVERRARNDGYAGLIVTNLFAYRATDPRDMRAQPDPIGPDNDEAILASAGQSAVVVCAWGQHGKYRGRAGQVLELLRAEHGAKLRALKVSGDGTPWHPLYVAYALKPEVML